MEDESCENLVIVYAKPRLSPPEYSLGSTSSSIFLSLEHFGLRVRSSILPIGFGINGKRVAALGLTQSTALSMCNLTCLHCLHHSDESFYHNYSSNLLRLDLLLNQHSDSSKLVQLRCTQISTIENMTFVLKRNVNHDIRHYCFYTQKSTRLVKHAFLPSTVVKNLTQLMVRKLSSGGRLRKYC